MDIKKEISYITGCAKKREGKTVRLGELLLFSTHSGDSWILDTVDKLAICLMRDGENQQYKIIDTPTQFSFDWDYKYKIENQQFITIDKKGNMRQILGYPVDYLR